MTTGGAEVCVNKEMCFFDEKRNRHTREERIRERRAEKMKWGCRRGVMGGWVDGWNDHTPPGGRV